MINFISCWSPTHTHTHSSCYQCNVSIPHQLNMGLLPLAWCETFRRGGVVQVGWWYSVHGCCFSRVRGIINLREAFFTHWLSACRCLLSLFYALKMDSSANKTKTYFQDLIASSFVMHLSSFLHLILCNLIASFSPSSSTSINNHPFIPSLPAPLHCPPTPPQLQLPWPIWLIKTPE